MCLGAQDWECARLQAFFISLPTNIMFFYCHFHCLGYLVSPKTICEEEGQPKRLDASYRSHGVNMILFLNMKQSWVHQQ